MCAGAGKGGGHLFLERGEAHAARALKRATGGNTQIDVQKVLDGEVDDKEVLDAVEQGFGLPSGFLGSFGLGQKKQEDQPPAQ